MLYGLAAPPIDPPLYLALGAGFVSQTQSDDVSLVAACAVHAGGVLYLQTICLPLQDDPASWPQGRVLGT